MIDGRLSYALEGPPGAPVLALSGSLGSTRDMWLPQVPALGREWRLLRIDHPGHGQSPLWEEPVTVPKIAGAALELLDTLGLERVSWCGLSLGGAIGEWLAAHAPGRVERLILCSTSAHFDPTVYRQRAETVRAHGVATVATAVVERWFTPRFRDERPDEVARYRSMVESIPVEGYAACCEAVAAFDSRPYLASITAPTLILAGAEDPATPVEHARVLRETIVGSRLQVIPGAAHLVSVEQPEVVNEAIASHLRGTQGGQLMPENRYERGMAVRRQVLGEDHVERALATSSDLTREFQELITRYAWGEIWARPGLDRRMRSAITVTALIALGRDEELALHLRAAVRNGLTRDEIKEILLQSAIYCGVPAANSAFRIASDVLTAGADE